MDLKYEFKNAWKEAQKDNTIGEIMDYANGYMKFLSKAKTERVSVEEIVNLAKSNGFVSLDDVITNGKLNAGDKVYSVNRAKAIALFVIGENPIEQGMRVVGGHIDSPRMDLKPNPLYESSNLGFLKTHYYGGIKKYQWTTIPLAIHGVVILNDGSKVTVCVGEDDSDPVFCVTDLLVHLAGDQMEKKLKDGVAGEALNVLVGNVPLDGEEKDPVKANILKLLLPILQYFLIYSLTS